MSEPEHYPFGPSVIKRRINCLGSYNLEKAVPKRPQNFYGAEGVIAHQIMAERILNKMTILGGHTVAEKGFQIEVTEEMLDHVMVYVELVRNLWEQWDTVPEVERRVYIDKQRMLAGTADTFFVVPYNRIIVLDFKYGQGVIVDVEDNEQCKSYALGALLSLSEDEIDEIPIVELIIVQPRAYSGEKIKRWEMPTKELLKWKNVLIETVDKALEPDAPLTPGEWCQFCSGAPHCPTLSKQTLELTKRAFGEVEPPVKSLTPEEISSILDKEKLIRNWLDSVEEYAEEIASKGTKIPGYMLEPKYGNRKWISEEAVYKFAGENDIFFEDITVKKLKSPAQLEKLIGKLNKELLKPLIENPFKGYALVKGNSELQLEQTKEAFNTIELISE